MIGCGRILTDNAKQRNAIIYLFLKDFSHKSGLTRSQNLAPPKEQVAGSIPARGGLVFGVSRNTHIN